MSNKMLLMNCVIGIAIGLLIYVFTDDSLYITRWVYNLVNNPQPLLKSNSLFRIMRNYGADLLWAYSLWFGITLVGFGLKRRVFVSSAIAILCGFTVEILQFFNIIHGTFDVCDLAVEVVGVFLANIVYRIFSREAGICYGKIYR